MARSTTSGATTGGTAVQAAVARAAADHDAAAFVAGWGVGLGFESQLVLFRGGGTRHDLLLGYRDRASGRAIARHDANSLFLLCRHEFRPEPLEDVVHEGLGHRDLRVLGEA